MNLLDNQNFWTFLGLVATGVSGWFGNQWLNRTKQIEKAPDIQASLNAMVNSMRDNYERLLALRDSDNKAMREELVSMRRRLDGFERHVDRIENMLVAAGLEVPARPEGA